MVYDKLKGMIADQLGVSEDEVKPEARLKEDLKADSASVMMLVKASLKSRLKTTRLKRSRPSPIW